MCAAILMPYTVYTKTLKHLCQDIPVFRTMSGKTNSLEKLLSGAPGISSQ